MVTVLVTVVQVAGTMRGQCYSMLSNFEPPARYDLFPEQLHKYIKNAGFLFS